MKKQIRIIILLSFIIVLMSTAVFADQIELQNGQKLRGEVQNDSLRLRTDYAELNLQSQYINKINRDNGGFVIRASENNRFSGQLLTEVRFLANDGERAFSPSEITSIDFSGSDSFSDNNAISVSLRNGDFFLASTVDNSIAINTSLGSPLNISYNNIVSIEYISGEDIYLVKRNNSSDIKSDLSGKKIIVWPAAGEIFELEFNYLEKIDFN
jgi:hypothetical protein